MTRDLAADSVTMRVPMSELRNRNVTVKESVHIRATPETVWDYTQDWTRRTEWDPAILAAEVLPGNERTIRARTSGGTFLVRYKLFDRPRRTSLAMTESTSSIVTAGGGSWDYAFEEDGTRFTQQNTLVIRSPTLAWLLGWLFAWLLRRSTRKALVNVKRILETQMSSS
jgi:uncharacterized protein YndB with AHSA1/START domain